MSSVMPRPQVLDLQATVDLRTAAEALGLSRTTAYVLAKQDQFPCRVFRDGGRYVVARGDLLRVLELPELTAPPGT